ncbi:c-type cytochrome [Mucilaginibacter myungsuensis]|uniref:C-type cytochrome n=1 Tax=Mucilaginibacter myungsuensis TaxID=649104 RepID=A0A929KT21_9SPHI|nr:cytochrome c [Mucilaginibacter myungsuensis]MBE9660287.1 c-type cytochrome [Mucilaginibacter myungsuensis]MDN3600329.1 cytochrome c [Mucilaginibacter myungsuensis]
MRAVWIIASFLTVVIAIASCQTAEDIEFKRYYTAGLVEYQNHCQNCHGDKGQGLAALIPPLTDTAYISRNKNMLACLLSKGIKGKITVAGKEFDSEMPPAELAPMEIAQVLTYVGNSFGNKVGLISNDDVTRDLKNCR